MRVLTSRGRCAIAVRQQLQSPLHALAGKAHSCPLPQQGGPPRRPASFPKPVGRIRVAVRRRSDEATVELAAADDDRVRGTEGFSEYFRRAALAEGPAA